MVFKHFQDCLHLEKLANSFLQLFQLCFHISQNHIPHQIACVLGASPLLAMPKPFGDV